ncbi:MAG: DUF1236 domain-containing protein [Oricola sp.]
MPSKTTAAILALAGGLLTSTSAVAQFGATATVDLNIRSGPGPQYEVIGTIDGGDTATVEGCLQNSKWCQVSYNGATGWSYSDYLAGGFGAEQQVVISQAPASAAIPVVEYDSGTTASIGAAGGAVTGALIAGPVGAAVGGVAGAAAGLVATPPPTVRSYIVDNRVEPVYLEGEVVVGAGLPEPVELYQIPDYEYRYQYVNGQPVLVDPGTRRIVYVYR